MNPSHLIRCSLNFESIRFLRCFFNNILQTNCMKFVFQLLLHKMANDHTGLTLGKLINIDKGLFITVSVHKIS